MMKIRVIVTTLVAVILIPVFALAGDVILIGNPSVQASVLSKHDVKKIFIGSKIMWEDGSEVIFVIQKGSHCHTLFLDEYIKKKPALYSNYLKKQLFTGKGLAPPAKGNDPEVINFVGQTKGAIGYVCSDTGLDNVKRIRVK